MTDIANKYNNLPASQIADAVNEALQKDCGAVIQNIIGLRILLKQKL